MNSLCLPDSWLKSFGDPLLVMVLAAYREANGQPFSERDCVVRTQVDRKTVRRKRDYLTANGILVAVGGSRAAAWLVDLVALGQVLDRLTGEKGTREVGEIETNKRSQKGPTMVPKGTSPPPASLECKKAYKKLAVTDEEKKLPEEVRYRIARSRLTDFGGVVLNDWTITNIVRELLRAAVGDRKAILNELEGKCEGWREYPTSGRSWGILVTATKRLVDATLKVSGYSAQPEASQPRPTPSNAHPAATLLPAEPVTNLPKLVPNELQAHIVEYEDMLAQYPNHPSADIIAGILCELKVSQSRKPLANCKHAVQHNLAAAVSA